MAASIVKPKYIVSGNMGAAITGEWLNIRPFTRIGFQVKWAAAAARVIPIVNGATATASGKHLQGLTGAAFTSADVGATLVITGTVSNNGTFTVATMVSGTHITTVEALTNETFTTGSISLSQALPAGAWGADVSYDGPIRSNGKEIPSGHLGPTALTLTSAQTAGNPATNASSFVLEFIDISAPWIRLTYAPTTGGGLLDAGAGCKDA